MLICLLLYQTGELTLIGRCLLTLLCNIASPGARPERKSGSEDHMSKPSNIPSVERSRLLRQLFLTSGEALYVWNTVDDTVEWDPEAADVLGVAMADLPASSKEFLQHVSPDDAPRRAVQIANNAERGLPYCCAFKFRHKRGHYHWVEERIVFEHGASGKTGAALGCLRVISETQRRQSGSEQVLLRDELTGLPNRSGVIAALESASAGGSRDNSRAALLLVNVDRLSLLNAAYGFDTGDAVLAEAAVRIEQSLAIGDVVGRFGGNQFGVVISDADPQAVEMYAQKLLSRFRTEEINSGPGPVGVTVSVGAVVLDGVEADIRSAIGRAEEALAQAKSNGRDRFVCYAPDRQRDELRQRSLKTGGMVLRALNDRRVDFAVQPVCHSHTFEPAFYECLMRIIDDEGNILPAGAFIGASEQLGIVRKLDRFMVERALEELSAFPDISLAVNVSAMTACDPTMSGYIEAMLRANRAIAERLVIEITETAALYEYGDTVSFITRMRDLGCRIAIDDFGAGFSSFRELKEMTIDLIKLDGQFVKGLAHLPKNGLFVDSLLALADGLGIPVVAECVETDAELTALQSRRVAYLQGYRLGEPTLARPWQQSNRRAG
jgi:diguanylate cyclase (GGDEF)-like protein